MGCKAFNDKMQKFGPAWVEVTNALSCDSTHRMSGHFTQNNYMLMKTELKMELI